MRAACSMLALATLAAAAPPSTPALAPTGKWVVDFDTAQCVASRNYGSPDKPLFLALKQPALGDVVQLLFLRPSSSSARFAEQVEATLATDGGAPAAKTMLSYSSTDRKMRIVQFNMPLNEFARVRAAQALTVRTAGLDETFALKDLERLMQVMDQCVADLRMVWNVGQPLAPNLAQGPVGSVQGLLRWEDYPAVALDKDAGGSVGLALLIDEQGKVADCTVTQTSGVAALDAQSCATVKQRARFKPAIGRDGKPAKSSWQQKVSWRIE